MATRLLLTVIAAGSLIAAAPVSGQIIYGQPTSGNIGFTYTSWKLDADTAETTVSQFWTPLDGFVPLGENFEGRFWVASAGNKLEAGDIDTDVFGVGDFRAQVTRSLMNDQMVAALGLSLPTGKRKLDPSDERLIIEQLSQSFLEFPMRRYGEGFGFSAMIGGANNYGTLSLGGGARYEFIGKYEPYEGVTDYDPGDLFTLYAGGDVQKENALWSLNLMFVTFLKDKLDGATAFKQGDNFDIQLVARLGSEERRFQAVVDYLIRGRNTSYDVENGDIIKQLKLYGNEFLVALDYTYQWPSRWYVAPSASVKLIESNEEDEPSQLENSNVFGFGSAIGKRLSDRATLEFGARYFLGSADGGNIDLTGLQLSGVLSTSF